MNDAVASDSRTKRKVLIFAAACLAFGVATSIDPLIGYAKSWGLFDGPKGQNSQGLLGVLLTIGSIGLLFRRKWGQVVVSVFFGILIVIGSIFFVGVLFQGRFLPAGIAVLPIGLSILAFRFLASPRVQAVLVRRAKPTYQLLRRRNISAAAVGDNAKS